MVVLVLIYSIHSQGVQKSIPSIAELPGEVKPGPRVRTRCKTIQAFTRHNLRLDLSPQHVMKFLFGMNKRLVFFGIWWHEGVEELSGGAALHWSFGRRRRSDPGRHHPGAGATDRDGPRIDHRSRHIATDTVGRIPVEVAPNVRGTGQDPVEDGTGIEAEG